MPSHLFLLLCLVSFNSWPLRCFVVDNSNIDSIGNNINYIQYLNEVGSVASFLQTPESQTFKSFTVWQLGESRNHPCETMLHSLNQWFVFLITRWPHWCTIFNMWAYQYDRNNCSQSHVWRPTIVIDFVHYMYDIYLIHRQWNCLQYQNDLHVQVIGNVILH